MAKATLVPALARFTQEQDDMGASEQTRALQCTRKLSISPNILELLSMPCCLDELEADYRPSISDNLKIGFAISDHATQTDISEIGDLKEFIVTTRALLQFTNSVNDEFSRYKSVLQAQYEEKIKEHASNLWLEISDRLKYIEEFYKQKEVKMRHSFQQQLCDALAILRAHYAKYYSLEEEIYGEDEDSIARKIERLRDELEEQAATIQSLEEELQGYKNREKFPDRDIETELLQQEIREFKEQMASLTERLTRLQETMKRREKEHTDLETEMKHMQERKERDIKTIQKLMTTQEILKLELDREKQRVLSKARELKEAQDTIAKLMEIKADTVPQVPSVHEGKPEKWKRGLKEKAAKEAAPKQAAAKEVITRAASARAAAVKETAIKEAAIKETAIKEAAIKEAAIKEAAPKEAAEEELLLESDEIELEKDRATERKEFQDEIKRLKKAEQQAKLRAQRIQQELCQSSRCWQMKFEILKKSLHAIKDEMFLRQSLRQSAKFRRTSLAERTPPPVHLQNPPRRRSTLTGLYMQYPPLPEIKPQTVTGTNEEESSDINKIPVTIEIPSAFEGESADEDDFEESSPLLSPLSYAP